MLAACSSSQASPTPSATPHAHAISPAATHTTAATDAAHEHASGHPHPSGTPTAEEQARADEVVRATLEAVRPFEDVDVAIQRGYAQAMPYAFGELRAAHFLSVEALTSRETLDPEHPEGLIYLKTADGVYVFLGVMYVATARTPALGGPLTPWHTHPELCLSRFALLPVLANNECPGGFPVRQDMIHVWAVENPAGPFAHVLSAEAAAQLTGRSVDEVGPVPLVDEPEMRSAVSNALGLAPAVIRERYDEGESIDEMAAAQNVDPAALRAAVADVYEAQLADAVAAEELTQYLGSEIGRFIGEQVDILMGMHPDEERDTPDTTEFGYPCVDMGCVIE